MKLLKTPDPEKQRLMEASASYKKELDDELKSISKNTESIITTAIFIGGAVALTYFAVSQLTSSKRKKKKTKQQSEESEIGKNETSVPNVLSQIGDVVLTQATMAILEFAKEKLAVYLQSKKSADENS